MAFLKRTLYSLKGPSIANSSCKTFPKGLRVSDSRIDLEVQGNVGTRPHVARLAYPKALMFPAPARPSHARGPNNKNPKGEAGFLVGACGGQWCVCVWGVGVVGTQYSPFRDQCLTLVLMDVDGIKSCSTLRTLN